MSRPARTMFLSFTALLASGLLVGGGCRNGGGGATTPLIKPTPTSLMFSALEGGTDPADQTIALTNRGINTLTWTVSSNAGWLTVSPTSKRGSTT